MPQILPVLLGGDANVYGMARSFYETYGVRSLAVCRRALPALAHSRIVQVAAQDQAFERDSVFTATLLGLAEQYRPNAAASSPAPTATPRLWPAVPLNCGGTYRFACPPPAALALADKQQFAAACRAVGLRTPQSITVYPGTLCSSCHSAGRSSSSLLTRPPGGTAISRASARSIWPGCRRITGDFVRSRPQQLPRAMLLQEHIPGPDTRLGVVNAYCAADGSVPWFVQGSPFAGAYTRGHWQLRRCAGGTRPAGHRLAGGSAWPLQTAGWRGFANFDLKYDRRGEPVLLFELNPRQGRAAYYCDAAGAPLARPLVEDLLFGGTGHAARPAPGGVVHGPLGRGAPPLPQQAAPCAVPPSYDAAGAGIPIYWPRGGDGKADLVCGKAGGIRQKITKEWGLNPCAASSVYHRRRA